MNESNQSQRTSPLNIINHHTSLSSTPTQHLHSNPLWYQPGRQVSPTTERMPPAGESEDNTSDQVQDNSASAAASKPLPVSDCSKDATIAQCFQAMQQLTSIFQFTQRQSQDAINAVGPDVTLAYNYILNNGGEDKGGAIVPIDDCPHLADCVKLDADRIEYDNICTHFKDEGGPKGGMKGESVDGVCPSGENWFCLKCGVVRCSRYVNGHCKEHWENTKNSEIGNSASHSIAVSLEDLSVWCYECGAYLNHPSLSPILKRLEKNKFDGANENKGE